MPSTARTSPAPVRNAMCNSLTSRSGGNTPPLRSPVTGVSWVSILGRGVGGIGGGRPSQRRCQGRISVGSSSQGGGRFPAQGLQPGAPVQLDHQPGRSPYLDSFVVGILGQHAARGDSGLLIAFALDIMRLHDVIVGVEDVAAVSTHDTPL